MRIFRLLAGCFLLLALAGAAHAELYEIHYSSRIYSVNGFGRVRLSITNQNQLVDVVAETQSLSSRALVLVYDSTNDAVEVVRRDDGTIEGTIMTFSGGQTVSNNADTIACRQAFLTIPNESGPNGSVAGPLVLVYGAGHAVVDERWHAQFQYNLPAASPRPAQVVLGSFVIARRLVPHI